MCFGHVPIAILRPIAVARSRTQNVLFDFLELPADPKKTMQIEGVIELNETDTKTLISLVPGEDASE